MHCSDLVMHIRCLWMRGSARLLLDIDGADLRGHGERAISTDPKFEWNQPRDRKSAMQWHAYCSCGDTKGDIGKNSLSGRMGRDTLDVNLS